MLKDPALRRDVLLERVLVPVEMVRGDVQQHRHPRPECRDMVELKAAHLQDRHAVRHLRCSSRPARTPSRCFPRRPPGAPRPRRSAGQRGRRGLSVGPGDGDDRGRAEPARHFQLAHHAQSRGRAPPAPAASRRDARTQHQDIASSRRARCCPRTQTGSPCAPARRQPDASCRPAPCRSRRPSHPLPQQPGHRQTAPRSAEDAEPCRPAHDSFIASSHLERRQAEDHQQDGHDVEPRHDLRLRPSEHLKMMMERRHPEHAPPFAVPPLRVLEIAPAG